MLHRMKLNPELFEAVETGFKTIELRLFDPKRQLVKIGDDIEFSLVGDESRKLVKKVKAVHKFKNFDMLYKNLQLLKCGYTPFTLLKASPDDMLEYYSLENQEKYGAVGIELEEKPLQRFIAAQTGKMPSCTDYETALDEIKNGRKITHWIWYIFPQTLTDNIAHDAVAEYYALKNKSEAEEFLAHPVLGKRLVEITNSLLKLDAYDPVAVFGITDAFKLRSCMTLFDAVSDDKTTVFDEVLEKYCMGVRDGDILRNL